MNYSPKGMYIWDAWYMPAPDGLHMYHLQRGRNSEAEARHDSLGHSFTTDLIDWEERPVCLPPDRNNPLDDCQAWTGSAVWHEGKGYLYYTMRGSATQGRHQHIGLATTDNPDWWTRFPGNPVITPDPRWYAVPEVPTPDVVDCRDLNVIKDPAGPGWYGYFATRRPAATLPETSVIGCAYSHDLIRWEQRPPAFTTERFNCVEVPDVFFLNDRWYMTCLTGYAYGNRRLFSDPNLGFGTIYLAADHPAGPFYELADNVLMGGGGGLMAPLSVRSFPWEGERYLLYTDRERSGCSDHGEICCGTVTTPKTVIASGDRLLVKYSPLVEKKAGADIRINYDRLHTHWDKIWGQIWPLQSGTLTVGGGTIRITNPTGWSMLELPLDEEMPSSYILEAEVTLEGALAAGFGQRMADQRNGDFVMLDFQEQAVHYQHHPWAAFSEKRRWRIEQQRPYRLRIVNRLEHFEFYVDDIMVQAFNRYFGLGGKVGIFAENGGAVFSGLRLRPLDVSIPE
jgi:hypothetical protein